MKHLPLKGKVFNFTHEEYAKRFSAAATALGLPFRVSPHQLCHSGPSPDNFYEHRDLAEIQARGLWRQPASVRFYEKHAMLLQMW